MKLLNQFFFTVIFISLTYAQSLDDRAKLIPGTFSRNILQSDGSMNINTRVISKERGKNKFIETVTFAKASGEVNSKFETRFTIEMIGTNYILFKAYEGRDIVGSIVGSNKWASSSVSYAMDVDENFIYEIWNIMEEGGIYRWMRQGSDLSIGNAKRMEIFEPMIGTFKGTTNYVNQSAYSVIESKWNESKTQIITHVKNYNPENKKQLLYEQVSITGYSVEKRKYLVFSMASTGWSPVGEITAMTPGKYRIDRLGDNMVSIYTHSEILDYSEEGKLKSKIINDFSVEEGGKLDDWPLSILIKQ